MKKLVLSICFGCLVNSVLADQITGYRGEVLYFTDNPVKVVSAYKYYPDGVLYVKDGKVVTSGDYSQLKSKYKQATIIDYSGKLIVPGFVDTHIHYPQTGMIASYGAQLLDWLNTYTFPTESQFSNPAYANKIANFFLDQLVNNGTTTALVFATVDPSSVNAFFNAAYQRNMRMISGKVLMDRNAPAYLLDTPATAYSDSKMLIEKWNNKGRLKYAVTPRFAPTSSESELAVAGRLLKEFPDVYMHTHLAENNQEVAWVHELFPWARSYLDVYDHYGLVTSHSVFAHSIHIDAADYSLLSKKHASIAFCPTSNLFLGSGLFNLDEANKYDINVGLGTDVGAGTSFSILQTMNEAYKVTQLRKAFTEKPDDVKILDPFEDLYLATLGGAKALSLDQYIGSFTSGKEADFVVLDPQSTPILKLRDSNAATLRDKIFAIEILGDDRTVEHTYIMGKIVK